MLELIQSKKDWLCIIWTIKIESIGIRDLIFK